MKKEQTPPDPGRSDLGDWELDTLERYLDGELDEPTLAALTEDLRRDHRLRARVTEASQLDDDIRIALTGAASARPDGGKRMGPAIMRAVYLALAAGLLLAATAWVLRLRPVAAPGPGGPEVADVRPGQPAYDPVRLVVALRPDRRPAGAAAPSFPAPAPAGTDLAASGGERRLEAALARGDLAEASRLVDGASPAHRGQAYRRLGDLIQSAVTAEGVLDRLPAARQLEVCAHWAAEPQLRPVCFRRLSLLVADPQLAPQVQRLALRLSADPKLRPWLRSYHLVQASLRTEEEG